MKNLILFLILIFYTTETSASFKNNIIQNLQDINNLSFQFEQNINGKIENGNCIIQYPKKIFCEYNSNNKKILVSNGRSLVIKTTNSYYIYPIEKTALNSILNKDFLINKIKNLEERLIDNHLINFKFTENENTINVFFDKKTFNLIGWQTVDIYQNISITHLNSISKNKEIKKYIFRLPKKN